MALANKNMTRCWDWISKEGSSAEKHQGYAHPMAALLIHYAIASIVTFLVHDALVMVDAGECALVTDGTRELVALGVAVYAIWLLLWRIYHASDEHRPGIVYEYTWLCNVTLLLGAAAFFFNRPIVATAHCVAVGIDQLMWYVDLVGWTVR